MKMHGVAADLIAGIIGSSAWGAVWKSGGCVGVGAAEILELSVLDIHLGPSAEERVAALPLAGGLPRRPENLASNWTWQTRLDPYTFAAFLCWEWLFDGREFSAAIDK